MSKKISGLFRRPALSIQSEQFKKLSKSSDWQEKASSLKKPLHVWTCKHAIMYMYCNIIKNMHNGIQIKHCWQTTV